MKQSLLIIDDEKNMRHMLESLLSRHNYSISTSPNGKEALAILGNSQFDFILCDVRMSEMDGIQFIKKAKPLLHQTTVIMMSAYGSVDMALEAIKEGAYDFISKPFKKDEVLLSLKKAEERERLKNENLRLKKELSALTRPSGFSEMIGNSECMKDIFSIGRKVAKYDTSVLITGESGTGKELVARGIHKLSPRSKKPMVSINCASIPASLLESEFFGFAKGAFTSAEQARQGLFEEADTGTLFLDEIGELPMDMQAKLLRVLQEQEVRPLGSNSTIKVDVRVVAATAKNLDREVDEGTFRQDLLFRFNVVELKLPPLRQRISDIPLLADYFLEKFRVKMNSDTMSISQKALSVLNRYSWPGNVRELENIIEHALIYADGEEIEPKHLPAKINISTSSPTQLKGLQTYSLKEAKTQLEKEFIANALKTTKGNKSQAATLLELSYPSLLSKIKEYRIE